MIYTLYIIYTLKQVAKIARQRYAKSIFDVQPLKTGALTVGGSQRQMRLQRSTTAVAKAPVEFDGTGKDIDVIRSEAQVWTMHACIFVRFCMCMHVYVWLFV
jgi:hypothetical protein